ncbi:hypothetical protein SHPE106448_16570 [Shewanella pealeana]
MVRLVNYLAYGASSERSSREHWSRLYYAKPTFLEDMKSGGYEVKLFLNSELKGKGSLYGH